MDPATKESRSRRVNAPVWTGVFTLYLILLTVVKELFYPHDAGFGPLRFHPVWLLVLAGPLRFGFWPGLAAALSSLLFYLWSFGGNIPSWQEPACFFLVAWILGEFRDRADRREDGLLTKLTQTRRELSKRQRELAAETTLREALQERIVGEVATFTALYESAKRLASLNPELIRRGALEVLRDNLHVDQGSIYEREGDVFIRRTEDGPSKAPATLERDPMLSLLKLQKSVVSVQDLMIEGKEMLEVPFLAMAPITNIQKDVIGFLAIEKIDFVRFSSVTLQLLGHLADWLSQSLQQAAFVESSRKQGLFHPELEVLSGAALRVLITHARTWEEAAGAETFPLGPAAHLEIISAETITPETQMKALGALMVLWQGLRSSKDILFYTGPGEMALWTPGRTAQDLESVLTKLNAAFQDLALRPRQDAAPLSLRKRISRLIDLPLSTTTRSGAAFHG